jgi:hypothetical protein
MVILQRSRSMFGPERWSDQRVERVTRINGAFVISVLR